MGEGREREISNLFNIGLVIKAITGVIEIAAGIAVAIVPRAFIARIANLSTAGELSEDPRDFLASHIRSFAHTYTLHAHYLLAFILTTDGVIKVVLVALLLRGYRFAYPLFIVAIAVLGSYEAYRAVLTTNLLLSAIVLLDIALVFLAAHEYKLRYPA